MDTVINWLLEEDDPSVRYFAMQSLLGDQVTANDIAGAREAIMMRGPVPELLEQQNEDGSWGDPARFYNDKYTGTVWTLLLLAELGADPAHPGVQKGCEFILNHAQNPECGGFSYTMRAKSQTGLFSGVIPCLTGNMVYTLIKLGYLSDPRVQSAIDWIVTYQRTDDGIEHAPQGKVYERYEMCWGKHTCHMGAAKTFKALAAIPFELRRPDVSDKLLQLADYFLKHHIYKKSHQLEEVAKPGWLKLGFPLMYQSDILELLEIFSMLQIKDPRLLDATRVLEDKRCPDGKWKLENTFNGKMRIRIEKKGAPSKWITLKALKILKE